MGACEDQHARVTIQSNRGLKTVAEPIVRRLQRIPQIVSGLFHAFTCIDAKA